jgi:hypothetical protein
MMDPRPANDLSRDLASIKCPNTMLAGFPFWRLFQQNRSRNGFLSGGTLPDTSRFQPAPRIGAAFAAT